MKERGKLLILEGGVGSGKTTQQSLLQEQLSDWQFYREPGGTTFGEKVRDAVQGRYGYEVHPYAALFGYSAARANLVRGIVIPRLQEGFNVSLDRYWYSTYAYQGAEGVSKPIIWIISLIATKALKPDLVLHYDLLPEIGMARKKLCGDADRYDVERLEFHKKVRRNYLELRKMNPRIWKIIDASQSTEDVFRDSLTVLKQNGLIL